VVLGEELVLDLPGLDFFELLRFDSFIVV